MADSIRSTGPPREAASGERPHEVRPPGHTDPPIDVDLYCLTCGYNLRGLTGDPVRCPECGNLNPVGLIEIPAEEIREQLARMESAPTASVAALTVFLGFALLLVVLLIGGSPRGLSATFPLLGMTFALGVLVTTTLRFRDSCRSQPGWFAALARFHAVTFLLMAAVGGVFVAGGSLAVHGTPRWDHESRYTRAMVLVAIMVYVLIRGLVPPIHRWVKTPMEQLQREVAVQMARERLRKELHRKGSRRRRQ